MSQSEFIEKMIALVVRYKPGFFPSGAWKQQGSVSEPLSNFPRILLKTLQGEWLAEEKALISMTPCTGQKISLLNRFHTFGYYIKAQTLTQYNYSFCDGSIVRIRENVTNE